VLFRTELRERLAEMSYPAFQKVIERLMRELGYTDVTAQRTHFRGRNSGGGIDIAATAKTGVTEAKVIAQIKHVDRAIQKRYVDELRGTAMRCGARQGLLITLSAFSPPARAAAASGQIIPIRLIGQEELLDLLIRHKIGVYGSKNNLRMNGPFFDDLDRAHPHSDTQAERPQLPRSRAGSSTKHRNSLTLTGEPMTWRTHVLAGITTLWLLDLFPTSISGADTWDNIGVLAVLAAFGALLPDLDAAQSKIKSLEVSGIRPFLPAADLAYRDLGHRGFLHSAGGLAAAGAVAIGLSFWWGWQPSTALWLGYLSHLAADACTPAGIPVRPGDRKRFHLLPKRLRITTGSMAEEVLFPFLAGAVLALLLSHLSQLTQ
jgi:inner membrane protein